MTAADLATGLGIPRATAYRIFTRLEQEEIVIPEPGGQGFAAGERLSDFAMAVLTSSTRHGARHRVLQGLVDEVGETCNLTTLSGGDVVYLDRVETHWPLRMHLTAAHASRPIAPRPASCCSACCRNVKWRI